MFSQYFNVAKCIPCNDDDGMMGKLFSFVSKRSKIQILSVNTRVLLVCWLVKRQKRKGQKNSEFPQATSFRIFCDSEIHLWIPLCLHKHPQSKSSCNIWYRVVTTPRKRIQSPRQYNVLRLSAKPSLLQYIDRLHIRNIGKTPLKCPSPKDGSSAIIYDFCLLTTFT